jgi:hypothetical protein
MAKFGSTGLRVSLLGRGIGIVWVHQQRDAPYIGHQLVQKLNTLGAEHVRNKSYPCDMTARSVETCHQSETNRVAADGEDDRDGRTRVSGSARRSHVSGRSDGNNALRHKLGRERRQGVIVAVRPPFLDADISTLDKAGLFQPLAKGIGIETVCGRGGTVEETNKRRIG